MTESARLRELPSVHVVLEQSAVALSRFPRAVVIHAIREALDAERVRIMAGGEPETAVYWAERVRERLEVLDRPSLRSVINATGVVLHTNLGRAPLRGVPFVEGYSNLEYDMAQGRRGKRDSHVGTLLERLTGAPGIAVNNNAAAIFLALNELAAGGEVIVSRGELIEIGDGFRIPEIMARSGATLREVGTTNRTHIDDYRAAINERTRMLLRVHPSNFRISGFTARPGLAELAALGAERGLPVYEDLGSGCVTDLRAFGIDEPLVRDSLQAGADVVSFSGDKLLGGPQAGILSGKAELIARLRRNPLFRALRLDKLVYQALECTLRNLVLERWEAVPAIAMIRQSADRIRERSEALLARMPEVNAIVREGVSVIGGGATPEQSIATWVIAIRSESATALERRLRTGEPPVIARIENDEVLLDLRTVFPEEEDGLLAALQARS